MKTQHTDYGAVPHAQKDPGSDDLAARDLALCFESLGGGSLNANGWAFGCEFAFFQRDCGAEPLSLRRWASIAAPDLIRALGRRFEGIDDPQQMEMREHTDRDWGATQLTYKLYTDHSHLDRAQYGPDQARAIMVRTMRFLRSKLLTDLTEGRKLFVYRTYDHVLPPDQLAQLAAAVNAYGDNTLLYVTTPTQDRPAFSVRQEHPGLLVGHIDHFAPQDGRLDFNTPGWEAVCRAALRVWRA